MSYCHQADLVQRFGERAIEQLSDHDVSGEIDATVIEQVIRDATAEIDSYLAVRYSLPLPHIPQALRNVACDIAFYSLSSARDLGSIDDGLRARYTDAIKWLEKVRDKKAEILGLQEKPEDQQQRMTSRQGVSRFDWGSY